MNLLITGATGFVGSALTRRLLNDGHAVTALVRPGSSRARLADQERLEWSVFSGERLELEEATRSARIEAVCHVASLFLAQHRSDDVSPLMLSNLLFPTVLLEAMNNCGVKHLVNIGTSWQHYGGAEYDPVNLYAATKQAFESILAYYVNARGFTVSTLKLFDTYGPGDMRRKLFALLRQAARTGETLKMSPGEQEIDLVYVDDVVEAICLALSQLSGQTGSRTYGVSSGRPLALKALVGLYAEVIGRPVPVDWGGLPYRPREVMQTWSSFQSVPEWRSTVPLPEGLVRMERDPSIGGLLAEQGA